MFCVSLCISGICPNMSGVNREDFTGPWWESEDCDILCWSCLPGGKLLGLLSMSPVYIKASLSHSAPSTALLAAGHWPGVFSHEAPTLIHYIHCQVIQYGCLADFTIDISPLQGGMSGDLDEEEYIDFTVNIQESMSLQQNIPPNKGNQGLYIRTEYVVCWQRSKDIGKICMKYSNIVFASFPRRLVLIRTSVPFYMCSHKCSYKCFMFSC